MLVYGGDQLDKVNTATAQFSSEVTDPKAQIISAYIFQAGQVRYPMLI